MEVDDPQIHARMPTRATQDSTYTQDSYMYGTVTLSGLTFQNKFHFKSCANSGPITPHLPCGIQFELCRFRSPLLTTSRLISLPPPTEMFQFGGLPIVTNRSQKTTGCPIRVSPDHRILASSRSLSQLGTPFIGTRTEPFTDRQNVIQHYIGLTAKIHLTSFVHTYTRLQRVTRRHDSQPFPGDSHLRVHRKPLFFNGWTQGDLNPRPRPCKGRALPAEL